MKLEVIAQRTIGFTGADLETFLNEAALLAVRRNKDKARSAAWLSHMSPDAKLHPDFGPSFGDEPVPYGIPITVVDGTHARVRVTFQYAGRATRALSARARHPGRRRAVDSGDRHAVVVDKSTCRLYETWPPGSATAAGAPAPARSGRSAATAAPRGWTSADAAGLPILPGLLR